MTDYAISSAWRRNDAKIEKDAIDFWRRTNILPASVSPLARAKELCAVAYAGAELAGVATASIDDLPFLRSRFAMFRCAVAPEHRRSRVGYDLLVYARPLLEQWSLEHPQERVQGIGIIIEGNIGERARHPVWPITGLTVAGYTPNGQQVRVAWFAHALVE